MTGDFMKGGPGFAYDPSTMLNQSHPAPTIDLAELDAAMHQAPGARAPLIVWMMDNHDDLVALFARRRVNWTRFCGYIAEHGFLNGKGEPLKPEAVRQCWKRARAVIARQRALPPLPGAAAAGGGGAANARSGIGAGAGAGEHAGQTAGARGAKGTMAAPVPPPAAPTRFKPVSFKPQKPAPPLTEEEEAERTALRQRMFGSSE